MVPSTATLTPQPDRAEKSARVCDTYRTKNKANRNHRSINTCFCLEKAGVNHVPVVHPAVLVELRLRELLDGEFDLWESPDRFGRI